MLTKPHISRPIYYMLRFSINTLKLTVKFYADLCGSNVDLTFTQDVSMKFFAKFTYYLIIISNYRLRIFWLLSVDHSNYFKLFVISNYTRFFFIRYA